MKTIDAKKLHAFGVEFLKAYGASQENAVIITDQLVDNDLKGIAAHGAMRLFEYAKFMVDGKLAESKLLYTDKYKGNPPEVSIGTGAPLASGQTPDPAWQPYGTALEDAN